MLRRFEAANEGLPLPLLSLDKPLLRAVQVRLAEHGVLDPPPDEFLGPAVIWALMEIASTAGLKFEMAFTPALARLCATTRRYSPCKPARVSPVACWPPCADAATRSAGIRRR